MRLFSNAITASLLTLSTAVYAADPEDMRSFEELAATSVQEWKVLEKEVQRDDVLNTLSKAGWPTEKVEMQLKEDDIYELFSRSAAPGVVSYLAVPKNGMGAPVEFAPTPGTTTMHQAGIFGTAPTAEQIRIEIVNGMQAAVDALCSMKARPNTIRAQASAFGIVEVEATWATADVCLQ